MKYRCLALFSGIICHSSFIAAVSAMAYMLYFGMTRGIAPLHGGGRILNLLLIVQFPVLHSFFLSRKGQRSLIRLFPKPVGPALSITAYSTIASLQVLALFVLWTPDSNVWFAPSGWVLTCWNLAYVISWFLLTRSILEAGAAVQTGYLGWSSVFLGKPVRFPPLPTSGLHSVIRHPIYLSFALITLTGPVWGIDHLMLAGIIVPYCIFGPLLKERRIRRRLGEQYDQYARKTPYMAPKVAGKGTRTR